MLARDETLANAMLDAIASAGIELIIFYPTPLEPHRFYQTGARAWLHGRSEIAADLRYRADDPW